MPLIMKVASFNGKDATLVVFLKEAIALVLMILDAAFVSAIRVVVDDEAVLLPS